MLVPSFDLLKQYIFKPVISKLDKPNYNPNKSFSEGNINIGLAVSSMKDHMTDEGWQIFQGLEVNGYTLFGKDIKSSNGRTDCDDTNIINILARVNPNIVVLQDKREWEVVASDFRDSRARFKHTFKLKEREDIFKLTILKDAQQKPFYHKEAMEEIGCHAVITYYHPSIVTHVAPYVRPEHLVRTYHSLNIKHIPIIKSDKMDRSLISGAVSNAYPLRKRLIKEVNKLPNVDVLKHPGYHRSGCNTPKYLNALNQYKVSICTSSMYGYALRKIIESTAVGCVVVTDLPIEDNLPEIDGNLVRINSNWDTTSISNLIKDLYVKYDLEKQKYYADKCINYYRYEETGKRLVRDIETVRANYN